MGRLTPRAYFLRLLAQLTIWLASEPVQFWLAFAVWFLGVVCIVSGESSLIISISAYSDEDAEYLRRALRILAVVACGSLLLSFASPPPWRTRYLGVTRIAGRLLSAVGIIFGTAALTNGFIYRLHATRQNDSDVWFVAAESYSTTGRGCAWFAVAGAAFVLGADLRRQPVHDHQLLPPSRPRWLAWPLAISAIVVVSSVAAVIPGQLEEATRGPVAFSRVMAGTAVLGTLTLLSPVPIVRHLGWLAVVFTSTIAATAFGMLAGLIYGQQVPDVARSDMKNRILVIKSDEPQHVADAISEALELYTTFLLFLGIGLLLVWGHTALRRARYRDRGTQLKLDL